jgi:mono/diheme cytochrome c family protein
MRALFPAFLSLAACSAVIGAQAQQANGVSDDIQKGHHLATIVCSSCHIVGPEQSMEPVLRPPAPSFESIARRGTSTSETIRAFLITAHRNIGNAAGMPNPDLTDFQTREVVAYLLSLRNPSTADVSRKPSEPSSTLCRDQITRVESLLNRARASGQVAGSEPQSSAARLHRQPTAKSVEQAASEAEKTLETVLALARKLDSEGLDAECAGMLKKIE